MISLIWSKNKLNLINCRRIWGGREHRENERGKKPTMWTTSMFSGEAGDLQDTSWEILSTVTIFQLIQPFYFYHCFFYNKVLSIKTFHTWEKHKNFPKSILKISNKHSWCSPPRVILPLHSTDTSINDVLGTMLGNGDLMMKKRRLPGAYSLMGRDK